MMSSALRGLVLLTIVVALHKEHGVHGAPAKKVIIVGAGPSGLAAAARLVQNHGFEESQITILEAENRKGGRINTVPYGSAVLELGAAYCHGTNNIVYQLANPAGLLHTEFQTEESFGLADNVQVAYPNTGRHLTREQWEQYRAVADQIYDSAVEDLQSSTTQSLGSYFVGTFPSYIQDGSLDLLDTATAWDLTNWDDRVQGIETPAPNWLDISGYGFANYKDMEGDEDITWKNGFSSLFPVLLNNVDIDAIIKYNSLVTSIKWNPDGSTANQVAVTTSSGLVYKADVVLVTVSLGVLKQKYSTMFTPALPSYKIKAIQNLGFGTVDKVILEFSAPWWNRNYWGGVNFLTAPVNRTNTWTSRLTGFFTMTFQPNMLIGWVTGSDTSFETMPEAQLLSICSKMLKGAIGQEFQNYTEPIRVIRSTWNSNPNFRGSYSYRSMASDRNNVWPSDLLEPEQDDNDKYRLLFSGEATQENYYSTVHAAIDTGYKQADRIAGYSY